MVKKKKIILVGFGFSGQSFLNGLEKNIYDIEIIDQTNHNLFQPLLYQVASAGLSANDIASPIRELTKKREDTFVTLAKVVFIDKVKKEIHFLNRKRSKYDILVLAPGSKPNYYERQDWEKITFPLKTISDALKIKNKILLSFELAEMSKTQKEKAKFLTFVIVGAGPTGTELAGSIAEIAFKTLKKNYRNINLKETKIILLESGNEILSTYSQKISKIAEKYLNDMGVLIEKNVNISTIKESSISYNKKVLECSFVIWAAGNRLPKFIKRSNFLLNKKTKKISVKKNFEVENEKNIFALGDCIHYEDEKNKVLPEIAPVAIQQGKYLSFYFNKNFKKIKKFTYLDKGNLATIGKAKAVGSIWGKNTHGFFAWIIWSLVHIFYLIGFKNKVFVALQWFYLYISEARIGRIITDSHSILKLSEKVFSEKK